MSPITEENEDKNATVLQNESSKDKSITKNQSSDNQTRTEGNMAGDTYSKSRDLSVEKPVVLHPSIIPSGTTSSSKFLLSPKRVSYSSDTNFTINKNRYKIHRSKKFFPTTGDSRLQTNEFLLQSLKDKSTAVYTKNEKDTSDSADFWPPNNNTVEVRRSSVSQCNSQSDKFLSRTGNSPLHSEDVLLKSLIKDKSTDTDLENENENSPETSNNGSNNIVTVETRRSNVSMSTKTFPSTGNSQLNSKDVLLKSIKHKSTGTGLENENSPDNLSSTGFQPPGSSNNNVTVETRSSGVSMSAKTLPSTRNSQLHSKDVLKSLKDKYTAINANNDKTNSQLPDNSFTIEKRKSSVSLSAKFLPGTEISRSQSKDVFYKSLNQSTAKDVDNEKNQTSSAKNRRSRTSRNGVSQSSAEIRDSFSSDSYELDEEKKDLEKEHPEKSTEQVVIDPDIRSSESKLTQNDSQEQVVIDLDEESREPPNNASREYLKESKGADPPQKITDTRILDLEGKCRYCGQSPYYKRINEKDNSEQFVINIFKCSCVCHDNPTLSRTYKNAALSIPKNRYFCCCCSKSFSELNLENKLNEGWQSVTSKSND